MAVFVPALAAKITIRGTDQGKNWSMSIWAANTGTPVAPTFTQLQALANGIVANLTGNAFLADMASSLTINSVEARDASVERSPGYTAVIPGGLNGSGGASAPTSMCAKILLEPAGGTPIRRPSQTFIPGIPNSALVESATPNTLSNAYIAAAEAFITGMGTAILTAIPGWGIAAVSKYLNAGPRATAVIEAVASVVTRSFIATQVRRIRRVGRKESAETLAARAAKLQARATAMTAYEAALAKARLEAQLGEAV